MKCNQDQHLIASRYQRKEPALIPWPEHVSERKTTRSERLARLYSHARIINMSCPRHTAPPTSETRWTALNPSRNQPLHWSMLICLKR